MDGSASDEDTSADVDDDATILRLVDEGLEATECVCFFNSSFLPSTGMEIAPRIRGSASV